MITDVKVTVRNALLANAALVALLGGKRIYQLSTSNATEYPRITFFEVVNRDSEFADDQSIASEIVMQIDVWSKGSTSAIAKEIDKTMKELGYFRMSAPDFYEEDTKVYHKAMRFRNTIEEDED
jgi:hypothetical protein